MVTTVLGRGTTETFPIRVTDMGRTLAVTTAVQLCAGEDQAHATGQEKEIKLEGWVIRDKVLVM